MCEEFLAAILIFKDFEDAEYWTMSTNLQKYISYDRLLNIIAQ